MRLAILIGVSEYERVNPLPACRADLRLMQELIRATEKYDEVVVSTCGRVSGADAIDKFSKTIEQLQGRELEEVFFYYTGHGDFFRNEFYYLLSDFDGTKRKQTTLDNSTVDNWLRSLNPRLAVKVVDACHSGIAYVKEPQAFGRYLEKTKGIFGNCYFMFSSDITQPSYQDEALSFFTRSFALSIHQHTGDPIRYKHIIDFISDHFAETKTQDTQDPFFVVQGTNTEIFCNNTARIKQVVSCVQISESLPNIQETAPPNNLIWKNWLRRTL